MVPRKPIRIMSKAAAAQRRAARGVGGPVRVRPRAAGSSRPGLAQPVRVRPRSAAAQPIRRRPRRTQPLRATRIPQLPVHGPPAPAPPARNPMALGVKGKEAARWVRKHPVKSTAGLLGAGALIGGMTSTGRSTSRTNYNDARGIYGY